MQYFYTDAIEIRRLTKRRGSRTVLSALDLTVVEGEFLALTGVNGAGKTTLIRCLLNLDMPTSGRASIFGRQHTLPAAREHLAYLPENFRPPYYLNGWEFLGFMCRLHGLALDMKRAGKILKSLDLAPAELQQRAERLSKGTAQKLGLAACLLSGKKLLILDEPLSGLDPRARACLHDHLFELKRRGVTCLFATHLLEDVKTLCDRVAVLHQSKLRYLGSPAACRHEFQAATLEQAWLRCIEDGKGNSLVNGGNGKYVEN
ncbi:MAG: ABC transporter ATP-binding protein [Gammaproteobacteria bacterium]|nr:ABC transporter ATP-binding protein [Gammaproteobacteria bacterium]